MSEIKKISLSGVFLGFAALFVTLQIPTWNYLTIEFSLVFVLIGRRYVGLKYTYIIAIIYPWFALFTPWVAAEPIGVTSLVTLAITAVTVDWLLIKDRGIKSDIITNILSIIIITIITTFLSLTVYIPAYYGFDSDKIFAGEEIMKYIWINLAIFIPFNLIKQSLVFIIVTLIKYPIKKHVI